MTKKVLKQYEFGFVEDCSIYSIILRPGRYLFQGWGASGGGIYNYGNGSYTEGELILSYKATFYVSVGGQGKEPANNTGAPSSCGGGGAGGNGALYECKVRGGGYGGGGSTDVRMEKDSILSRILVAAGGGGESGLYIGGGDGGDITSKTISCYSDNYTSAGASQNSGYSLFYGEDGRNGVEGTGSGSEGNGGGGGGYYGGNSSRSTAYHSSCGGAGGSSYISGHPS